MSVGEAFEEGSCEALGVVEGVVLEHDRRPRLHLRVVEDLLEGAELRAADLARSDEREARERRGEANKSDRAAEVNERKRAVRARAREGREIRPEKRGEVAQETARAVGALGVRVVVARDEADALGRQAELVEEEALDELELALKGEV